LGAPFNWIQSMNPTEKTMLSTKILRSFVMCAVAVAALPALANTSPALNLKRVTLSSSGVGYFEYEAQVERDGVLRLPVKLDQVNDVLKSLVVYDASGQIAGVSLPGREPLAEMLRQLPFDAAALSSMPDLLRALSGAELRVNVDAGVLEGRIMAVEAFTQRHEKGTEVQRHRASLLTPSGLRQFVIEEAKNIQFQDATLREQIASALMAMHDNRAKDGRTVEIITRGNVARTVRVGFVTSAPIWKTAYRLTVPTADAAAGSKSNLQGWAVIENMSGQDWRGVELTLTTGKPVAFQQNLYESVFNQRPTVAIEMPGRIVPRADTGAVQAQVFSQAPAFEAAKANMFVAPAAPAPAPRAVARPAPAPAPAAAPASRYATADASPPVLAQVADLASNQDQGTQVSYKFPLPVSVGNGHSLSVPIIMQELSGQRVAQYQPQVSSQFPLAAIGLANTTANALPPGAVTVYEQGKTEASFLGDAQLAALPAGESRMLAFALDQKISISASVSNSNTTTRASVERATLVVESMQRQIHSFSVKSNHQMDQSVVVDVPRYVGYTLVAPSGEALGESQGRLRVKLPAPAGTARVHEVTLEQPVPQRLPLQNLNAYQLQEYLRVAKDEASQSTLRRLLVLRQTVEAQSELFAQANATVNEQQAEQARLRENLSTVSRGSELYKRYSAGLNEAENQILAALKVRDAATAARNKAEVEVRQMLTF
jgi:Domain of unknown function (DUF4139)